MPTIQTSTNSVFTTVTASTIIEQHVEKMKKKQMQLDDFINNAKPGDIVIWKHPAEYHSYYVNNNVYIDKTLVSAYAFHKFTIIKTKGLHTVPGFWQVRDVQSGNPLYLYSREFIPDIENTPKNHFVLKLIDKFTPDCRLVCSNLSEFLSEIKSQLSDEAPFTKERFDKIKLQLKPFIVDLKKNEDDDESDYILEKLKTIFAEMSKVVVANPAQKAVE